MFSISMEKFLYRKSHYKKNCMNKGIQTSNIMWSRICHAWWEPNYTGELEINPVRIDETGNERPSYGGSWNSGAGSAIVHSFPANNASFSTDSTGFRVVRSRN